jgi:hypothetical protein
MRASTDQGHAGATLLLLPPLLLLLLLLVLKLPTSFSS